MTPTLRRKLEALAERREELERLLADPGVAGDNERFRNYSREFAQLEPVALALAEEARAKRDLASAEAMRGDPDLGDLAEEEIAAARARLAELEDELSLLLVPRDNRDDGNLFLEVRAGTGGDEAAIFAGDLFRMYARYAERQGWRVEIESDNPGEHGGYKEIVAKVSGRGAFSRLKFESGTHRVQRVPETESQGRIHTSTQRWRSFPTWTRSRTSPSIRRICGSTPSAPPAPAASTSTRPNRPSALNKCLPGWWSNARPSAASTPTATRR